MRGSRYAVYAALTVFVWCHYDARRHKRRRRQGNRAWRSLVNRYRKNRRQETKRTMRTQQGHSIQEYQIGERTREFIDIWGSAVFLSHSRRHFPLLALRLSAKLMRGRYLDRVDDSFPAASPEATVRVRSTASRSSCGQDRWKWKETLRSRTCLDSYIRSSIIRFWDTNTNFYNCSFRLFCIERKRLKLFWLLNEWFIYTCVRFTIVFIYNVYSYNNSYNYKLNWFRI